MYLIKHTVLEKRGKILTLFDFNGTIQIINLSNNRNKIEVKMGVYAEPDCILELLQDKMCENSDVQNLVEIHVNLRESANYLIQLFYQTKKRYSCTRTKVGKLLSIVAFVYAKSGKKLFDEAIFKYDNCGTSINELKVYIDRDVYIQYQYEDDCQYINSEFLHHEDIIEKHKDIDSVDDTLKKVIEDVFRNFGAFSAYDLGQCINPIVNLPQMVNEKGEIQLHIIPTIDFELFAEGVLNEKNSFLVEFLVNGGVNGNTTD